MRAAFRFPGMCRVVILTCVMMIVAGVWATNSILIPRLGELRRARSALRDVAEEHAYLKASLRAVERLGAKAASLDPQLSDATDEVFLAGVFGQVEKLVGRFGDLRIVNVQPWPAENRDSHRVYRIRLAIAGGLPVVTQFLTEMTHGATVVGIEALAFRGIQGRREVECTVLLQVVRPISRAFGLERTAHGNRRADLRSN